MVTDSSTVLVRATVLFEGYGPANGLETPTDRNVLVIPNWTVPDRICMNSWVALIFVNSQQHG